MARAFPSLRLAESYSYNDLNQMTAVLDSDGSLLLTTGYSPEGFVTQLTVRGGRRFLYSYRRKDGGKLVESAVTDPQGYATQFAFTPDDYGYTQSLPLHSEPDTD
jgi:hypothetical protein